MNTGKVYIDEDLIKQSKGKKTITGGNKMRMSQYCKSQGMTIDQYKQFAENIENTAAAIIAQAKTMFPQNTGMYFPVNDILTYGGNTDMKNFIIQSLKKQGMEFFDNNTLWRY